ncbi:MAG: hypothetical protein HEP71_00185 [Roseivirga sp.]|nr:hypothetical protein [Roseivirga sp.]
MMVLIALMAVPKTGLAQQSFNLNNVLIASKEGTKRISVLRTGQKVKCKLKGGEKAKGDLYVYSDHIEIGNRKVEFEEIEMIKPVNLKLLTRQLGGFAFNEVIRRQSDANFGTGYLVRNGVFIVLNLTVLNKKIKTIKGWTFRIKEMPPMNLRRRR